MTLVIDNREETGGGPGVHALIVGVSAYPHLPKRGESTDETGLRQVASAAVSAYQFYRWLLERGEHLPAPLATVRLLLAPSDEELADYPELKGLGGPCKLYDFLTATTEWRKDAASHRENVTFFFFVGLGLQRMVGDAVLLLEDFNDGIGGALRNAVSFDSLYNGMLAGEGFGEMARTQFYFLDTSRGIRPTLSHLTPSVVFDHALGVIDDRVAPVFYSTTPGNRAYAIYRQPTFFVQALLRSLNGAAAEAADGADGELRWQVTVNSLSRTLAAQLEELTGRYNINQRFILSGTARDAVIHHLDAPPEVEVLIHVEPPEASANTSIEVTDAEDETVLKLPAPVHPHPHQGRLPAGFYTFRAVTSVDGKDYTRLLRVMPPRAVFVARMK